MIDYTKALKQRNKLLEIIKETGRGYDQLDFWTNFLIKEGAIIQNERQKFFNYLDENINSLNEKLNLTDFSIHFKYLKNEISKSNFEVYKTKELYTGNTLIGPHKDDFEIYLNKKDVSQFGSRGQQRMALTALKLLELEFIFDKTSQKPILLLDDIFSELDNKNKLAILNLISRQQTIVTSVYEIPEIQNMPGISINIESIFSSNNN